jgi:hypothetical protein
VADSEQKRLGRSAAGAWKDIAAAHRLEDETIAEFERLIVERYEAA